MEEKFETPFTQDELEMKTLRMEMQVDLMKRLLGETPTADEEAAWVNKNSTDFKALADQHPEVLEEYRTGDRRIALENMEELLSDLHESRYNKAA